MKIINIRGVEIGKGVPKICVPITGKTKEEIIEEAENIRNISADIVEWRVDCYQEGDTVSEIVKLLRQIRQIIGEIPLLFTVRTHLEGGNFKQSPETYKDILWNAVQTECVDLLDVEVFSMESVMCEIIREAKEKQIGVVASHHDFQKTPPKEELVSRWAKMQETGADLLKIAVMPNGMSDVLTLLGAAYEVKATVAKCPIIAISMSETGVISRIAPEIFGSSVTFASGRNASAPGQIPTEELKNVLESIHCIVDK